LLYYSGVYWYDQLEVQDKLYKKDFLKKMRTVDFKEITKVEQHKSIIETYHGLTTSKPLQLRCFQSS